MKLESPINRDPGVPVHKLIRERVLSAIETGSLVPGDRLPGEPDWADSLGVSRMTLNKAILSLVRDGWLERVRGSGTFVSNPGSKRRLAIAVLIKEEIRAAMDDHYFGTMYFSIADQAEKQGFSTELLRVQSILSDPERTEWYDGYIVVNPNAELLRSLGHLKNLVVLGSNWPGLGVSCIDSDNIQGAALAVQHLASLGHKNILFVGGCPGDSNSQDRLRGFYLGADLSGVELAREVPWTPIALRLGPEAEASLREILQSENPPTAILAGGPHLAMCVLGVATELGLEVPKDLSIVTFDDPAFLTTSSVKFTTIVQPMQEMSVMALDELVRQSKNPLAAPTSHIQRAQLILRQSTAKPFSSQPTQEPI